LKLLVVQEETPRIANNLLRRIRDFAQVKGKGVIDVEIARYGLTALNVDEHGLDEMDNRILSDIIEKFSGGTCRINYHCYRSWRRLRGQLRKFMNRFLIQEGYLKTHAQRQGSN
jgi:Holliday junction DNA helicase RuvB